MSEPPPDANTRPSTDAPAPNRFPPARELTPVIHWGRWLRSLLPTLSLLALPVLVARMGGWLAVAALPLASLVLIMAASRLLSGRRQRLALTDARRRKAVIEAVFVLRDRRLVFAQGIVAGAVVGLIPIAVSTPALIALGVFAVGLAGSAVAEGLGTHIAITGRGILHLGMLWTWDTVAGVGAHPQTGDLLIRFNRLGPRGALLLPRAQLNSPCGIGRFIERRLLQAQREASGPDPTALAGV